MRWDGQWSPIPYPGAGVTGVAVAPDGGLWALLTERGLRLRDAFVARYAEGTWSQFPAAANLEWLMPAPGGRVCGVAPAVPELVCIDPRVEVSRAALPVAARAARRP